MVYLVVLVNVSILYILYENIYILSFLFITAGRDGIKGEKGDSGRHGKILKYSIKDFFKMLSLLGDPGSAGFPGPQGYRGAKGEPGPKGMH